MLPKSLTVGEPGGVYFLHGDDDFRKGAAVRALVDRALDPATRDFNLDVLNGGELTTEHLASVMATPPMMAERRVVVVRDAEALTASANARKIVLETAQRPPPGLVLILQARIPERSKAKFYKDLARLCQSAEFRAVTVNEVPAWLVTWARDELAAPLEVDAARALASAVGTDLGVLTGEVRKLVTMVGVGMPVTVAAVEKGGLRIPRQDRWAWFDLVGNRRTLEAVEGLQVLLSQGETAVGLVIGISSQLLRVGVGLEGGPSALEAALPPYQRFLAKRLLGQAKNWQSADLAEAIRGLRKLDQLLKSSSISAQVLMEEWLLGIAAREPNESAA